MREQFSDSDLIAAIIDRHRAVLRAIHAGTAADWAGLDLTMPQLKVLLALDSVGPISIGAVARELRVGLPAASQLVDRLVEQGYVERREDPTDRRRTIASLSPAAVALMARLREGSREVMEGWMRRMDRPDLERLASSLTALAEVAGRADAPDIAPPQVGR
jgi:DNA-binding MarR family transcriptional regulator